MRRPEPTTAHRGSLLVVLADEDLVRLDHVARAVGHPRSVIAGALVSAALEACLELDLPPTASDQEVV